VSLAHTHRVNKMYSHERSIEDRKPAPAELTPVQLLSKRQYQEKSEQAGRFREEQARLMDKHQNERNSDPITRNGGGMHDLTLHREREEREELNKKQAKAKGRLDHTHKYQMEAALKEHGVAP
jgi:hypothetical protein